MGIILRVAGGIMAATLIGVTPSAADAHSAPNRVRIIRVPCASALLPAAITTAIGASPAIVRLSPRCTYITSATLNITSGDVTILGGPSTAIRGNPVSPPGPLLNVSPGATLRARGIVMLGGRNSINGGAIVDLGNLVLDYVTLTGNETDLSGGALAVDSVSARALVSHTVIKANTAVQNAGGLLNRGTLTLFESSVSGNTVTIPIAQGRGGGILTATGGTTRIIRSTIDKNTSARLAGGIVNEQGAVTSLLNSLVVQNKASLAAPNNGGGIFDENPSGGVLLRRTIVRTNTPNNCGGTPIPGCVA